MPAPSSNPFGPLKHRPFRALWGATLVANAGAMFQSVGAAWAMGEMPVTDDMVALVQTSTALPVALVAIVAGALADNFDRRRIMLASQVTLALVSLGLTLSYLAGLMTPWSLLAFTFAIGVGAAVHSPAWQSAVHDLVPKADLPSAVGLNAMSFNLVRTVAPALAGALVAAAGPAATFALNALCHVVLIVALWRWPAPQAPRALPPERLDHAIGAGVQYALMSPGLLRIVLRGFLFGLGASVVLALLPVLTRDVIGGGPGAYGGFLAAFGCGGLAGGLAGPFLRGRFSIERVVAGTFGLSAAGAAAMAWAAGPAPVAIGAFACGAAWVTALSLFNASAQLASPRWVVGRVLSIYQSFAFGGVALGSWIWGTASEALGPPACFGLAAALLVAGGIGGRLMPMPGFGGADLDPTDRFARLALPPDLEPRSGPIVAAIRWQIAPGRSDEFLALMADRKRIRLRNGARRWALMRDINDPGRWVETFSFPTFLDYLRHNERFTNTDAELSARLLALHVSPDPPVIERLIQRHIGVWRDEPPAH